MADYIDRQALLEWFKNWSDYDEFSVGYITGVIEDEPPVDAVRVVRCNDCKYWDIFDAHSTICPDNRRCKGIIGKMYTAPDYYCAYGERKDV